MRAASASHTGIPEVAPKRSVAPGDLARRTLLSGAGGSTLGLALAAFAGTELLASSSAWAAAPYAVPGEDLPIKRTWMAWPSSTAIWGNLLSGIQADIVKLANEIAKYNPVILCADGAAHAATARSRVSSAVTVLSSIPVDDCWMRDTGPNFRVDPSGALDAFSLNFNGWGNEQAHGKDRLVAGRIAAYLGIPLATATVTGEGGGVIYDGDGTLIANKSSWLDAARNPGKSVAQIEAELLRQYGATKMIWCEGISGQDITDDHIDSTVLYVRPGQVIVQLSSPSRPASVWSRDAINTRNILLAATDAKGRRLQVTTIYGPSTLPRVPAAQQDTFFDGYLNCAITNGSVITAQFGDATADAAAKVALEAAFGRPVVQLNLDRLMGQGGGGAHCVTMNEPVSTGGGTPPPPTGPTISADRTTVSRGGQVKAIVAGGPGNRSDWVGLYRSAATDTQGGVDERYLNGSYSMPAAGLTSATVTFTAPSTPGTYNFRFFASNGYTRLAVSKSFTVT